VEEGVDKLNKWDIGEGKSKESPDKAFQFLWLLGSKIQ
jgi:hypothetical protein